MRSLYDEFDEFDFDDNALVRQLIREQELEELRLARRHRRHGPRSRPREDFDYEVEGFGDYASDEDYEDLEDLEDLEDFEDYDDNEFDEHSGLDVRR